jgi:hypothetical protein
VIKGVLPLLPEVEGCNHSLIIKVPNVMQVLLLIVDFLALIDGLQKASKQIVIFKERFS